MQAHTMIIHSVLFAFLYLVQQAHTVSSPPPLPQVLATQPRASCTLEEPSMAERHQHSSIPFPTPLHPTPPRTEDEPRAWQVKHVLYH